MLPFPPLAGVGLVRTGGEQGVGRGLITATAAQDGVHVQTGRCSHRNGTFDARRTIRPRPDRPQGLRGVVTFGSAGPGQPPPDARLRRFRRCQAPLTSVGFRSNTPSRAPDRAVALAPLRAGLRRCVSRRYAALRPWPYLDGEQLCTFAGEADLPMASQPRWWVLAVVPMLTEGNAWPTVLEEDPPFRHPAENALLRADRWPRTSRSLLQVQLGLSSMTSADSWTRRPQSASRADRLPSMEPQTRGRATPASIRWAGRGTTGC